MALEEEVSWSDDDQEEGDVFKRQSEVGLGSVTLNGSIIAPRSPKLDVLPCLNSCTVTIPPITTGSENNRDAWRTEQGVGSSEQGSETIPVDNSATRFLPTGDSARRRRKSKVLKARDKLIYTLDNDINAERVLNLTDCALIGRMEHTKVSHDFLKDWLTKYWKLVLNYVPLFSLLANGWYLFHLLSATDRERILVKLWLIGKGSMVFTR